MMQPQNAIISVSDKSGIVELGKQLRDMGCRIISTGGTAAMLRDHGVEVIKISDLTGFPEILGGRVKTLHPKVYGGLLADRDKSDHLSTLKEHGIHAIDLVVVNLYPFVEAVESGGDAVENIDIGGVSLIRAAAKNHKDVGVLTNPGQYQPVIDELKRTGGLSPETRKVLAVEGFKHTSAYDASIQAHFSTEYEDILKAHPVDSLTDEEERMFNRDFPPFLTPAYRRLRKLRYGENPHQRGALYQEIGYNEQSVINAIQLNGQKLSYNNMLDFTGALNIVREFEDPTAVLIKHNNPCGVASAGTIARAYEEGLACDPMSAFGGIIALNREVDEETAQQIRSSFKEGVIAPSFHPDALAILKRKKKIVLLEVGNIEKITRPRFMQVEGGLLLQDPNLSTLSLDQLRVASEKAPSGEEIDAMLYAWKVIKHIRSNGILLVKGTRTVGIGAGQMSRVDSSIIACRKAGEEAMGSVMASDAFIPFADSVDIVAKAGITAIIQPGGSIRDQEVLEKVNEYGIAMVYTGTRNFKH
jgi:phosphoribosylaminoimidazolecarboxamide formyltransferase / IMP cyclohydrolase